jgi:hypothetical protein
VDDDVIGSEPERAPRRRSPVRGVRLPGGWGDRLRQHRRAVAALGALVLVVGAVAALRAGVAGLRPASGPGAPVAGAQGKPPLAGTVLTLAAGQNTLYALATDCSAGCRPMLVGSTNDGATWSTLTLPGLPSDASAIAGWRLAVSGVEDSLAVEDDAGTVTVGSIESGFVTRRITAGPAFSRVPAGREPMVRICAAPRCPVPRLEYLEPRTGVRAALLMQPPVLPRALGVDGTQLWVAGGIPGTRFYGVAVSVDDAATWTLVRLPLPSSDPALVPQILPVPELDTAWLLFGRPARRGQVSADELWVVPAPGAATAAHEVRPEMAVDGVTGAVGLKDGRLALVDGGLLTVLSQDGEADRMAASDVDSVRYVLRQPQRGPHLLLVALALRTDGVAAIATSTTGNVGDWKIRPVVL